MGVTLTDRDAISKAGMERIGELARMALAAFWAARDALTWLLHQVTPHRATIRSTIAGLDPQSGSPKVAVYVHFDPAGIVHDYVLHQLSQLAQAGFRIVFVSNAPLFPDASRARVLPLCWTMIWRNNIGYDFGAYKDGIASIGPLDRFDSLLLMNDSVYGPFHDLSTTLAAVDPAKIDFWGIADNWEHQYHLQTFFIVFHRAALSSPAFSKFWREHPYIGDKGWVIRNGEVMLTQRLARAKLRGSACVPYWQAAERMKDRLAATELDSPSPSDNKVFNLVQLALLRGRPINSMHYFWDIAIEEFGCPFIKRELLKSNPARMFGTARWPEVIRASSNYDVAMIERHLAGDTTPDNST